MSASGPLLPFQKTILSQITGPQSESDGLLILARGLGLRPIICRLLKVYDSPTNLVVVINATEEEEQGIADEIGFKLKAISHEMPAKERQDAYATGGIVSITSRILVVDMLNKNIPVEKMTGLIVLHAEKVTPTSTETFIVRLYREHNNTGFLKAFSDQPEQFTFGISPLQTVLTQLKVRNVYIWPRFHDDVQKGLGKRKADVQEFYQPMSPLMQDIQQAILECMEATLSEVKRSNASLLEVDDLTIDNALFKSFDTMIRAQLDPQWHKLSFKSRQLVADLTTLRNLLTYLLSMDCVAFNQYLETVISSNGIGVAKQNKSPWLFLPAAETLINAARQRVYLRKNEISKPEKKAAPATAIDPEEEALWASFGPDEDEEEVMHALLAATEAEPPPKKQEQWYDALGIQPVLEEQPKWSLLSEVLDEIETDLHWAPVNPESKTSDCVLIMCDSATTCTVLRHYLALDPSSYDPSTGEQVSDTTGRSAKSFLTQRLKSYFYWKGAYGKMSQNLHATDNATPNNTNEAEESAALKRKREWKNQQPAYKRRRVRGGGAAGASPTMHTNKDGEASGSDLLATEADNVAKVMNMDNVSRDEQVHLNEQMQDVMPESFDQDVFEAFFGLVPTEDLIIIRPYGGDEDDNLLEELRPRYIIMFDPDTAFIRRVESYRASHAGHTMRVYFLVYEGSVEEQRYLTSIRREKDAFERIISERGKMALTLEAEKRPGEQTEEAFLRTVSSRIAGGAKTVRTDPPKVIVDVREFRSSLPSLLHAASLHVVPMTLGVGDYVLSPDMCVERKSIPDLVQSFNSGRLYQQCELMSIYYKQPILLIEFDQKRSFSLETYTDPKGTNKQLSNSGASDTDLHSKLTLLTLTFPKLRIIWSSSPYSTAEIFTDLKNGHHEPDPDTAAAMGAEDVLGTKGEDALNQSAQEVLRNIPGITSKNYRYVMRKVDNLEDVLGHMEVEELAELIGVEAANQVMSFVTKDAVKS